MKDFLAEKYGWTFSQIDEMKDEDIQAILIKTKMDAEKIKINNEEEENYLTAKREALNMARRGY